MSILTTTAQEIQWLLRNTRAPRLRTMAQFAEQEIRIQDDPAYPGYRIEIQPFGRM